MPAYMLITAKHLNREKMKEYGAAVPPLVAKFGGRYIAMDREPMVLERCDHVVSVVVSEWPDKAAARKFWDSAEYAEAKKLREGAGEFDVVVVDRLPGV